MYCSVLRLIDSQMCLLNINIQFCYLLLLFSVFCFLFLYFFHFFFFLVHVNIPKLHKSINDNHLKLYQVVAHSQIDCFIMFQSALFQKLQLPTKVVAQPPSPSFNVEFFNFQAYQMYQSAVRAIPNNFRTLSTLNRVDGGL